MKIGFVLQRAAPARSFRFVRDQNRKQALARLRKYRDRLRAGSSLIETRRMPAADPFFDTNVMR